MLGFVKISKYAGTREDIVQAGGGNTSVKLDDNTMAIKASGIQLANITLESGYAIVDAKKLANYLDDVISGVCDFDDKTILEKTTIKGMRPSIETFLHAITDKYTLHSHATTANILLSQKNGIKKLKSLFPGALFVDYATPGLELAKLYYKTYLDSGKKHPIIFLKNHGVVVSAPTAEAVIELHEDMLYKIEDFLGVDASADHMASKIYNLFYDCGISGSDVIYKVQNKTVLDRFVENSFHLWSYQFCPDCIVYCGLQALKFDDAPTAKEVNTHLNQYGMPILIICHDNIYIKAADISKAKEIESVLAFSAQISHYIEKEHLDLLTKKEQRFLVNWDAEIYRKQLK